MYKTQKPCKYRNILPINWLPEFLISSIYKEYEMYFWGGVEIMQLSTKAGGPLVNSHIVGSEVPKFWLLHIGKHVNVRIHDG